jgi:hypothetical protein
VTSLRVAAIRALEALEDGDQASAVDLLLAAVEDGGARAGARPPRCSVCGVFAYPGESWRHVWSAHQAEGRRAI